MFRTGIHVGSSALESLILQLHTSIIAVVCTCVRCCFTQSRIHRNAFMNSSLREDVWLCPSYSHSVLFFLLHPLTAGLSAVTSVHEVTAAACCPPRRPAAHSPPHISRQVSRTCGGSPLIAAVFSHSVHT